MICLEGSEVSIVVFQCFETRGKIRIVGSGKVDRTCLSSFVVAEIVDAAMIKRGW